MCFSTNAADHPRLTIDNQCDAATDPHSGWRHGEVGHFHVVEPQSQPTTAFSLTYTPNLRVELDWRVHTGESFDDCATKGFSTFSGYSRAERKPSILRKRFAFAWTDELDVMAFSGQAELRRRLHVCLRCRCLGREDGHICAAERTGWLCAGEN